MSVNTGVEFLAAPLVTLSDVTVAATGGPNLAFSIVSPTAAALEAAGVKVAPWYRVNFKLGPTDAATLALQFDYDQTGTFVEQPATAAATPNCQTRTIPVGVNVDVRMVTIATGAGVANTQAVVYEVVAPKLV